MTLTSLENIQEADEDHSCTSYADPEQAVPTETKLAKNETKAVVCLRVGLATVLLSAALLVSLGIYFFTRGTEESEFQSAFADQSTKILENFQQVADRRLGSIAAFGSSITAHTLATNASFPFVTIPAFEEQASHVLSLSGADSVSLWTIVEPEDRPFWENEWVPSEGPQWINESMAYANKTDADSFWPGWRGVPEQDYIGKPSPGSNGITYKQIFNRNSAEQVP